MNRFAQVKETLDQLVGGRDFGAHGPFWRGLTRDEFVNRRIFGQQLLVVGDASASNIIKALQANAPFGVDVQTPGSIFRRMPAGLPPASPDQIALIAQWINDGCPDDVAEMLVPPEVHNAFWRDFDNWAMFNSTTEVDGMIDFVFGLFPLWIARAHGADAQGSWQAALNANGVAAAIQQLSTRQIETVHRHYGNPMPQAVLFESFALFGAGVLPPDPLRPVDPLHQMNGPQMWFLWSTFAEAALQLNIQPDEWTLFAKSIFIGLAHDGLVRGRFPVDGFTVATPPIREILDAAAGMNANPLDANGIVAELQKCARNSRLFTPVPAPAPAPAPV